MAKGFRELGWRFAIRSGLGKLCTGISRGRLQILCYHGFSFDDEHRFRGKLFMTSDHLDERLSWLRRNRFAVLDLGEATQRLHAGRLGEREIVITIDDGFHGVHALAAPVFEAHAMRATVYVTTYYVAHPNPVFRLAIQYMAWKSARESVDVSGLLDGLDGAMPLHGADSAARLAAFYERAETDCTEDERVTLAREFGRRVTVDYEELRRTRRLSLMSATEIRDLAARGFDIQLHSHRHCLPLSRDGIARELADNRAVLEPLTGRPLRHFCYPSGDWVPAQLPSLAAEGIETATTCIRGLNGREDPLLALRRFLDGQDITSDEFAAEMFGIKDLIRRALGLRSVPARGSID